MASLAYAGHSIAFAAKLTLELDLGADRSSRFDASVLRVPTGSKGM
jgi:hypothetical protein